MVMNDEPPIIIVDNRKLTPISRITRGAAFSGKRSDETSVPFGVVDRVTISKAAREKYRESQSVVAEGLPAPQRSYPEQKTITYDAAANLPKKRE
jgi:hypothetical protein